MRINPGKNNGKTVGGRSPGAGAPAVWTLAGVALLAACAHDSAGFFGVESDGGESGGGSTSEDYAHWTVLAAVAIITALGGGGGVGGQAANRGPVVEESLPVFAVTGTDARDDASDLNARAASQVQANPQAGQIGQGPDAFPFRASDPEGDHVLFSVAGGNMGERASERTPDSKYDEATFNYGSMVRGQYGALYYNDVTGAWTFEADARKVNTLGSATPASDVFEVSALDTRGARSDSSVRLVIRVTDGDEVNSVGVATWTSTGDLSAVQVGDRLTVTLVDADHLPDAGDITYEFFHDNDGMGGDRTVIGPQHAAATAADTGVVDVDTSHVGRHIGVLITYTDLNGYAERVPAYANGVGSTAVVSADSPGVAVFDPGIPINGDDQSVTVRLSDANGVPADVVYQFFYTDNADGTGTKAMLPAVTRDMSANSNFATLTGGIPSEAVGKYIGVEIRYDDGVGDDGQGGTSDTLTEMMSHAVTPAPQPQTQAPRNYGPQISPEGNLYGNLWHSVSASDHREHTAGTLIWGERGYRNDPQHTPNEQLQLTYTVHVSGEGTNPSGQLLSVASVPAWPNRGNVLVEIDRPQQNHDMNWDTKYGRWTMNRIDKLANRGDNFEEQGGVDWTYQAGYNGNQRAELANFSPTRVEYDHLFLQVSDGMDSDIVRLSVQIRGSQVPESAPARHVPDQSAGGRPTTGPGESKAAPTLSLINEDAFDSTTPIYVEGTHTWNWDRRNHHNTLTRKLKFGDDDTADGDLRVVFHADSKVIDRHAYARGDGGRTELDMPTTYGKRPGFHPSYADGSGDIAFYEYGQRGFWDEENRITVSTGNTQPQTIEGDFGRFRINRIDSDPTAELPWNETGVLEWIYQLHGPTPSFVYGGTNSRQRDNTEDLTGDQWGVDMVHLQVYDRELNRSEVRTIMAVIEGRDGDNPTPINFQVFTWEQSFKPYDLDPAPSPQSAPQGLPAYYDDPGDGAWDGPPPTDYVIM